MVEDLKLSRTSVAEQSLPVGCRGYSCVLMVWWVWVSETISSFFWKQKSVWSCAADDVASTVMSASQMAPSDAQRGMCGVRENEESKGSRLNVSWEGSIRGKERRFNFFFHFWIINRGQIQDLVTGRCSISLVCFGKVITSADMAPPAWPEPISS